MNPLPIPPTHLVAATDDLFALTLLEDGGLDHLLRRLIAHGMDPVLAFRCATYHAAYRLQRVDLGAVVAGRQADVIVLDSLDDVAVNEVFVGGRLVAAGGRMLDGVVDGPSDRPLDTMHLAPMVADDFRLRLDAPDGEHRMRVIADAVMTRWTRRPSRSATAWSTSRPVTSSRSRCTATVASTPPPRGAARGLGRLDRRGRHDGRARHAQPGGVRP